VIEDDGDGIELPAKVHDSGVGLSNIAERVRMIGGTLSVDSAPGKGTRITVKLTRAEKVNDPAESTQSPTVLSTLAV
jgi:signal transduction histidine kinase